MLGVGAAVLAVPPVAVVYHFKLLPPADNAVAAEPEQYSTGLDTVGAEGVALIITLIDVLALSQPKLLVWLT